ncbi:plant glycogenin-like starch initiation protein 4 [Actinidia rufa]|uniref:Plant glycogenin-like starch initiation protein 4 n=1 Tax=Actinidia rufa TaxID=165716 RepID=A0A7J0F8D2_9ERIC|nr:plant glycogenin-like starch initiation protein 4 [Actinidia rufa]
MDGVGENDEISRLGETVVVHFDRVDKNRQWSDFFPKWIDEDEREGPTTCPKIPMPEFEDYQRLDVVVARVPCGRGAEREGIKDVFRLQLNLVVANLLVRSGCSDHNYDRLDRTVYAVFIGSCGPMREIFRCDDLLFHEDDDIFVYRPNLRKLKQKVLMPVGTCQIAPLSEEPGVMLVEPSKCMFETLMEKMDKVASYDATDQGFLNEMFTWWHRWPSKVNSITLFDEGEDKKHEMIKNPYAIHYLGIKPWMCQTDHDCNWDVPGLDRFASDSAHKRWVQVYDSLPKRLQSYCEVTLREDPNLARIKKWRESYKNGNWNWKTYLFIALLIFFSFLALSQRLRVKSAIVYVSSLVFHKICKNEIKEKNGKGK